SRDRDAGAVNADRCRVCAVAATSGRHDRSASPGRPEQPDAHRIRPRRSPQMKNARTPLVAILALGSALAMPLALAQSAVTPEVRAAEKAAMDSAAAAQNAQSTQDASAQDGAAGTQPAGRQLGWNDVDADGNGTIS